MTEEQIRSEIESINKKLDIILQEIELQRRHRQEIQDLKEDLFRIGKDIYNTAIEELEEVHDHIKTGDILHLFKKLLRNVNNLTKMFETIESVKDFIDDFAPISKEVVLDFMNKLDELDRKGYFLSLKELSKTADKLVMLYKPEDLKQFSENLVGMINTLNYTISVYRDLDKNIPEKVSYISLLKELNSPQVRKNLFYILNFLKSFSIQQAKLKM